MSVTGNVDDVISRELQLPTMGDPVQYINPYYTRQEAGDSLSPLQAYRDFSQNRPMQAMQGWTPFQAPDIPTMGVDIGAVNTSQLPSYLTNAINSGMINPGVNDGGMNEGGGMDSTGGGDGGGAK